MDNYLIAICGKQGVGVDSMLKFIALIMTMGGERVSNHIRDEERLLADVVKDDSVWRKYQRQQPALRRMSKDFELIIQRQRESSVRRIKEKLKDRDVYIDITVEEALSWNEVHGERLTVYPFEIVSLEDYWKMPSDDGHDWSVSPGNEFFVRPHVSIEKEIGEVIAKKVHRTMVENIGRNSTSRLSNAYTGVKVF